MKKFIAIMIFIFTLSGCTSKAVVSESIPRSNVDDEKEIAQLVVENEELREQLL